ncbi:MAG TPA: acyl-CoA dehydrogenase family protein [Gaiellaceae bacterium]|nr:acyl-CoA dehydrogenase family protein [Gaiellaceae bacterium]
MATPIDFELSDEQTSFREAVLEFARRELAGDKGGGKGEHFSREAWRKCAEFGIQGLPVPPEYGGTGARATTIIVALEALGYGCSDNGLIFSLNAQMWACEIPIVRFGAETQKRRYLPGLCDGSLIAAQGMSEPSSGSDAFSLTTTARKKRDRYVLNGAKTFVTNAPEADLFVLFATTDPGLGFAGLCAFLVERDTPGLTVGAPLEKMGLGTSPMSELFLDGCEVSNEQVLGRPGGGMAVFNSSMEWERGCILASTVGTMQRQVERCVAYARDREQFGQPIGKFQAVSHRIVEMKVRLETARLLLYRLGSLIDGGRATPIDSALTKLYLSECFVQSSLDALQVHGGYGYMKEYDLERDVRDAIGSRIYSGTSEVQRNVIARYLGL